MKRRKRGMMFGKPNKYKTATHIGTGLYIVSWTALVVGLMVAFVNYKIDQFQKTYIVVEIDPNNVELISDPNYLLETEDYRQIMCLARNLYFEARNESDDGLVAVANVTINRAIDPKFPPTICQVVYQAKIRIAADDPSHAVPYLNQCQFSWFCDGKPDVINDRKAWERSYNIAFNSYLHYDRDRDITLGATFYHADYVSPRWASRFNHTVKVDTHLFYSTLSISGQ